MPFIQVLFQVILISYTVTSPFLFFLFHRHILKEKWDGDLADRVTVRLYVISNIAAQFTAYMLQTGEWCGNVPFNR